MKTKVVVELREWELSDDGQQLPIHNCKEFPESTIFIHDGFIEIISDEKTHDGVRPEIGNICIPFAAIRSFAVLPME